MRDATNGQAPPDTHLLLTDVAGLELAVDRLRKQGQFPRHEVRDGLKRVERLRAGLADLAEWAAVVRELAGALHDLDDIPGYYPAHDQVAVAPWPEQVFRAAGRSGPGCRWSSCWGAVGGRGRSGPRRAGGPTSSSPCPGTTSMTTSREDGAHLGVEPRRAGGLSEPAPKASGGKSGNLEGSRRQTMTKVPTLPQGGDPQADEGQPRPTAAAAIQAGVIRSLGRPADLYQVTVRSLWEGHYRVNVWTGPDATSVRVAHSYFVAADGVGVIATSVPRITREYP